MSLVKSARKSIVKEPNNATTQRTSHINVDDLRINSPKYDTSFEPSFASQSVRKNITHFRKGTSEIKQTPKGVFVKLQPHVKTAKPYPNIVLSIQHKRSPFSSGQKQKLLSLGCSDQTDSTIAFQQLLSARNASPIRIGENGNKMSKLFEFKKVSYRSSSHEKKRPTIQIKPKMPSQMSFTSSTVKHSKDWDMLISDKKLQHSTPFKIQQCMLNEKHKATKNDTAASTTYKTNSEEKRFSNLIQLSASIRKQTQQLRTVQIDLFKPRESPLRSSYSASAHSHFGSFLNLYSSKIQMRMHYEIEELTAKIRSAFEGTSKYTSDLSYYRIGKVLGKGAFGKVNLGLHKLSGKLVAIKSINKKYVNDADSQKKVIREITILKKMKHPNVMRLYETFETANHILFITELCPAGDLLTYVRKRRKLKESYAKVILKQILDSLNYIHSKSILHRDVKLDNILLSMNGEIKVHDSPDMRFWSQQNNDQREEGY